MKATVFGVGYVGLVQAAALAETGHDVVCVDVDVDKIERLKRGEIPIYEPGLDRLVRENLAAERLRFTTDAREGVEHGDVQFIAVGTPPGEDGSADLKYVLSVASTIAGHMSEAKVVVVKSTVPVGTCDKVRDRIAAGLSERGQKDIRFDVVSNPEFLKEGSAVNDCLKPDRIIIGVSSERAEAVMRELYAPFNRNHEKIIVMDVRSSELTKYAANCMLATKISFMNEMANLADMLGADIENVRKGIGADPRIGYHFIYPGAGYGGSCFPKDVKALIHTANELEFDAALLKSVEARNNYQKNLLFRKIDHYFGGDLQGKVFALWGLAFKPNTDDLREAPSLVLMEALWAAGAHIRAFDPQAMKACAERYGKRDDLVLCGKQTETLEGADALIVITEWKNFLAPDYRRLHETLRHPVIFDGRNLYDPQVLAGYGLQYFGIGRSSEAFSAAASTY